MIMNYLKDFEAFMSITSNLKVSSSDALKLIEEDICVKVGSSVELSTIKVENYCQT